MLSSDQLGQAIDYLRPNAAYTRYDTYANLVSSWTDATTCPTETELETAWTTINKINQVTALNNTYASKLVSVERSIALINIDNTRTDAEKTAELAEWATMRTNLANELNTKQEAIING